MSLNFTNHYSSNISWHKCVEYQTSCILSSCQLGWIVWPDSGIVSCKEWIEISCKWYTKSYAVMSRIMMAIDSISQKICFFQMFDVCTLFTGCIIKVYLWWWKDTGWSSIFSIWPWVSWHPSYVYWPVLSSWLRKIIMHQGPPAWTVCGCKYHIIINDRPLLVPCATHHPTNICLPSSVRIRDKAQ